MIIAHHVQPFRFYAPQNGIGLLEQLGSAQGFTGTTSGVPLGLHPAYHQASSGIQGETLGRVKGMNHGLRLEISADEF
jgi:hypothetical protein